MAYSTLTDLTRWIDQTELVRLCSSDPAATIASTDVVAVAGEAIESADSQIDGCLLARWPSLRGFSPVPAEINRISALLALYNLYLRRRSVTEQWQLARDQCVARLEAAARGEVSLGLDQAGATAPSSRAAYQTDANEESRKFTDEALDRL